MMPRSLSEVCIKYYGKGKVISRADVIWLWIEGLSGISKNSSSHGYLQSKYPFINFARAASQSKKECFSVKDTRVTAKGCRLFEIPAPVGYVVSEEYVEKEERFNIKQYPYLPRISEVDHLYLQFTLFKSNPDYWMHFPSLLTWIEGFAFVFLLLKWDFFSPSDSPPPPFFFFKYLQVSLSIDGWLESGLLSCLIFRAPKLF